MAMSQRPPQYRSRAVVAKVVRMEHGRFVIEADRHGTWRVLVGENVVAKGGMPQDYFGKPRWGSAKLLDDAIALAKAAADNLPEGLPPL